MTRGVLVIAGVGVALTLPQAAKAATFTVGEVTTPGFSYHSRENRL